MFPTASCLASARRDDLAEVDTVVVHVDHLIASGRQVFPDIVGPDRQFPVAAIDHHRELDCGRAAIGVDGIKGARTVRPVNSTSSTSTIVFPATSGISLPLPA